MEQEIMKALEEDFLELILQLEGAFNYTMPEKQAKAYWKWLKDKPIDELRYQVDKIIRTDHKFPSIARLMERKMLPL